MQRKAARRLRAAKYRLTVLVHKPGPPQGVPMRHRMSPLESLRRFQIDCGDLDQPETPLNAAVIPPFPPAPLEPKFSMVRFGDSVPEFPPPGEVLVAENTVPPLVNQPVTPIIATPVPIVTPEPVSFLLVLTGVGALFYTSRRKGEEDAEPVAASASAK